MKRSRFSAAGIAVVVALISGGLEGAENEAVSDDSRYREKAVPFLSDCTPSNPGSRPQSTLMFDCWR